MERILERYERYSYVERQMVGGNDSNDASVSFSMNALMFSPFNGATSSYRRLLILLNPDFDVDPCVELS